MGNKAANARKVASGSPVIPDASMTSAISVTRSLRSPTRLAVCGPKWPERLCSNFALGWMPRMKVLELGFWLPYTKFSAHRRLIVFLKRIC